MGTNQGFGKVIMFNEHFVVYGIPAIASAIDRATTSSVEPWDGKSECDEGHCGFVPGMCLVDDRPETPGYKVEKFEEQRESVNYILKAMDLDLAENPLRVKLGGDLICASGLGASAASCTAMARALSEHFDMGLDDARINEIAYQGERGYHGTPSGIDNTAATYGGMIWFIKGENKTLERLSMSQPVEIVVGNTGLTAKTTEVVADVRARKEEEPERFARIFKESEDLATYARKAIGEADIQGIGMLMDMNHELLQQIDVSCEELDLLVDIARNNGAIGAKMTGTGRGGNMIALTPGKDRQEKVARAIEAEGFEVLRTRIG